jgi:hypothetical protein
MYLFLHLQDAIFLGLLWSPHLIDFKCELFSFFLCSSP